MILPSLETTPKTITVAGNFVFITPDTLNRPDLHFEGAGNGPVVITWIGREHDCTAAHLRTRSLNIMSLSDMIEGSYRSWHLYTTGQLVDGLQQKKKKKKKKRKENRFSLNENGIMSSFLGRQFYRSILYKIFSLKTLTYLRLNVLSNSTFLQYSHFFLTILLVFKKTFVLYDCIYISFFLFKTKNRWYFHLNISLHAEKT